MQINHRTEGFLQNLLLKVCYYGTQMWYFGKKKKLCADITEEPKYRREYGRYFKQQKS